MCHAMLKGFFRVKRRNLIKIHLCNFKFFFLSCSLRFLSPLSGSSTTIITCHRRLNKIFIFTQTSQLVIIFYELIVCLVPAVIAKMILCVTSSFTFSLKLLNYIFLLLTKYSPIGFSSPLLYDFCISVCLSAWAICNALASNRPA